MTGPGRVRLFDHDPDLALAIEEPARQRALESVVVNTVSVEAGPCDLHALLSDGPLDGRLLGMLVLEGTMTTTVQVEDRSCTRMQTQGSITWFDGSGGDAIDVQPRWRALSRVRVAALDDRFLAACARWPRLLSAVTHRLAEQDLRTFRAQAVSQLPRVEDRLLGILWDLADQSGHVTADGVRVDLPLTHETLGNMIGARRPTVSLGLRELERDGSLVSVKHGWLLRPGSRPRLGHPPAPPRAPAQGEASDGVLLVSPRPLLRSRELGLEIVHRVDDASAIAALEDRPMRVVVVDAAPPTDEVFAKPLVRRLRRDPALADVRLVVVRPPGGSAPSWLLASAHATVEADELAILAEVQRQLEERPRDEPGARQDGTP